MHRQNFILLLLHIAWKDSSLKRPITCWVGWKTSLTRSYYFVIIVIFLKLILIIFTTSYIQSKEGPILNKDDQDDKSEYKNNISTYV